MTHEMKARFRLVLLLLALLLTALSLVFIHDQAGNTIFISGVERWQYVDWTPNIVEVVVIWAVYAIGRFVLLRSSSSGVSGAPKSEA